MEAKDILDVLDFYAKSQTGCLKVTVGCAIVKESKEGDLTNSRIVSLGANRSLPNCREVGICNRVKLYGNDSKEHRLPSDCNAIHSEIEAIINCREDLKGCTAYITRYPCEACARALVKAGITKVVYGRQQEISEATRVILNGVKVIHMKSWDREDVTN